AAAGKLTNTATGTILLGARTFNPVEARFLSVDPVHGGCANPYTYAFGDPLNQQDLSGQSFCLLIDASTAISLGKNLEGGEGVGEFVKEIIDKLNLPDVFNIAAEVAKFIAAVEGAALVAAGELSIRFNSGSRPDRAKVLLVFPSLHIPWTSIDSHIPIGPPVPVPAID